MSARENGDNSIIRDCVVKADERYHFKLSEILRQRHKPVLVLLAGSGTVVFSSIPEGNVFMAPHALETALNEARDLLSITPSDAGISSESAHIVVEKPDDISSLVIIENKYYSVTVFPLYAAKSHSSQEELSAVLIEPIAKPMAEGIAFKRVQIAWALSNRELDVIRTLMSGCTDKAIANRLDVSVETIRAYLKSIRLKIGVGTRTAIVHKVHEMNSIWHREDVGSRVMQ